MKTRKPDLTRWSQNLTTALLVGAASLASAQTVEIPDPGLQAAIRAALNKPAGDITVEDMEQLTELDASILTRGLDAPLILSLQGLEAAINLASLDLRGGFFGSEWVINVAVEDFSPLANLPRLASLDVSWNYIPSLTLPERFTSLTVLDLAGNGLTNLTLPDGLTSLTTLNLGYNGLTSLTLPAGLTNLDTLDLGNNALTGLTLPDGLTSLEYLDVYGNPLSYLAVPTSLDLDQLSIVGFPKEDILYYDSQVETNDFDTPELVATYGTDGDVQAVAVSDGYAYVASGAAGFLVVDVSDPESPGLVGQIEGHGFATDVEVSGEFAYVATGTGRLEIVNVSNPTNPAFVGGIDVGEGFQQIGVSGNYVLSIGGSSLVQILDVIDPSHPTVIGQFNTGGTNSDIIVSGSLAYVASGSAGLQIIDFSDPSNPALIGSYATGFIDHIALSEDYIFAETAHEFLVLSVADPSRPIVVWARRYPPPYPLVPNGFIDVLVEDNLLYLTQIYRGPLVSVWDVGNPFAPVGVGEFGSLRAYPGFVIEGNYGFVPTGDYGLQIFKIREAIPQRISSFNTSGFAGSIAVSDGLAYVAYRDAGLQIIDVMDAANPKKIGQYNPNGIGADKVALNGDYAYVIPHADSGIHVVDISNPASPKQAGIYHTNLAFTAITVAGQFAYAGAQHGSPVSWPEPEASLEILDLTNPESPVRVGSITARRKINDIAISEGVAFVICDWSSAFGESTALEIIDVTSPTNPARIGEFEWNGYLLGISMWESYALVAAGYGGLLIVDVTDPSNPFQISQYQSIGFASDLAVTPDGIAYVVTYSGVQVIDVSDPKNPVRIGGNSAFSAEDIALADGYSSSEDCIYVAAGGGGLIILNPYAHLHIGPAFVSQDGQIHLSLKGANGQRVLVQRSTNLIDWEDWQTVDLEETGAELTDDTSAVRQMFYRAVEDNSMPANER